MPTIDEIDKAIAAHAAWKAKLKAAVAAGTTSLSVEIVEDDHRCDFGKWLHGDTAPRSSIRERDHRAEVARLHKEFHKVAAKVIGFVLQGKIGEAQEMLGLMGAFGVASSKLTAAMIAWKQQAAA